MLDEEEVMDHNCPTLLLAFHPDELHKKVREHVATKWAFANSYATAGLSTVSIDDIQEMLYDNAPQLSIQLDCQEV
jgi:uncharacterized protein YcbX